MTNTRAPNLVLEYVPTGRRNLGRPSKRGRDTPMKTEKPGMTCILLFLIMASCGSETVLRVGLVTAV